MKNLLSLFVFVLFFISPSFAQHPGTTNPCQQWATDCNLSSFIYRTGPVGIGSQQSQYMLTVSTNTPVGISGGGILTTGRQVGLRAESSQGTAGIFIGKIAGDFTGNVEIKEGNLKVYKNIYATEVHVKLPPFPDYVFGENYNLQPLSEVKAFIEKNKHLPNYPSAEEIAKEGIGVGALQVKQMQTIEELMLYVIELKEEIEELKARVGEIDKENNK